MTPTKSSAAGTAPVGVLAVLVGVLATVTAAVGVLWQPGSSPRPVVSLRGETVLLFGRGVYRNDSLFVGAGNRGTDLALLIVGIPLLVGGLLLYRRGGYRGRLLLAGGFALFLYSYGTLAVNAAYNAFFLAYVALTSAGLFGLVLVLGQIDPGRLAARLEDRAPRRAAGWLMVVSGAATGVIWLAPIVADQVGGPTPAHLDTYTTFVTYALDCAVITPACLVAGVLILRGRAAGYRIAAPLLALEATLAPTIAAQTGFQLASGVELKPAEVIGPVAGFVVLAGVASLVLVRLLRAVHDRPAADGDGITTTGVAATGTTVSAATASGTTASGARGAG